MDPATETRCWKHYCPTCHEMEFVAMEPRNRTFYPTCCGKDMRYLGIVDAIPGRDATLKKEHYEI